jgi:hypothetical protein
MADSSFDPLALVKAMGPQRDPGSWAELYFQDAAKGQQLREEIKNRLLLHESDQKAREREGSKDRASREGIAKASQEGQDRRVGERLKQWQQTRALAEKNWDFPPGAFPADAETAKSMGIGVPNPIDVAKTHRLVVRGSHKIYVPIDAAPVPAIKYPAPLTPGSPERDDGY